MKLELLLIDLPADNPPAPALERPAAAKDFTKYVNANNSFIF